jgi:hypothetical protein
MASRFNSRTILRLDGVCWWLVCFAIGLGALPWPSFDQPRSTSVLAAPEPNADSIADTKILRSLNRPTNVEWQELPLDDCVQYLAEFHGIVIHLDKEEMDAAKMPHDVPVTLRLWGTSLRSVLKLLLEPIGLDYAVIAGGILVTTRAVADGVQNELTYQLDEIIRAGVAPNRLMEIIAETIDRPTWEVNQGEGAMWVEDGLLHVRQRLNVQQHVHDLLRELTFAIEHDSAIDDEARLDTAEYSIDHLLGKGISNSDFLKWLTEMLQLESTHPNRDKRLATIERKMLVLRQPAWTQNAASEFLKLLADQKERGGGLQGRNSFQLAARSLSFDASRQITSKRLAKPQSVNFTDLPLEDVLSLIEELTDLDLHINESDIKRAGIDLKLPCTFNAKDVPLRNLLGQILEPHKLDWYLPEPNLLVVTSRTAAAAQVESRVYRIGPILAAGQTREGLVKQLITTIEPNDWSTTGGPGTIQPLQDLLIVVHNRRVHEQISRFLANQPGR